MRADIDSRIVALCGSETRVLTLGVLANAEMPLSGYRVAKVAGLPEIKVYQELRCNVEAGLVEKSAKGYTLLDPDVRALLRKRIRLSWSEEWYAGEAARASRAKETLALPARWFDRARYAPNPAIAARYAKEIERPAEKDRLAVMIGRGSSRKRR